MNITYDKPEPKYKLGDEFTSDVGNGMLSRIGYNEIGMIMITGEYKGSVWCSNVKAKISYEPTDEEVEKTFGTNGIFKPVNPREPNKVILEVTTDELKILWTRVNKGRMESDDEVMICDTGRFMDIKYNMWKAINNTCVELGLKEEYGKFEKE